MYLGRIVEIAPARELYDNAAASLHRGAAVGRADPRPDGEAQAHHAAGRRAQPDPPAVGLPLPHPLPLRHRPLRARSARRSGIWAKAGWWPAIAGTRSTIWRSWKRRRFPEPQRHSRCWRESKPQASGPYDLDPRLRGMTAMAVAYSPLGGSVIASAALGVAGDVCGGDPGRHTPRLRRRARAFSSVCIRRRPMTFGAEAAFRGNSVTLFGIAGGDDHAAPSRHARRPSDTGMCRLGEDRRRRAAHAPAPRHRPAPEPSIDAFPCQRAGWLALRRCPGSWKSPLASTIERTPTIPEHRRRSALAI